MRGLTDAFPSSCLSYSHSNGAAEILSECLSIWILKKSSPLTLETPHYSDYSDEIRPELLRQEALYRSGSGQNCKSFEYLLIVIRFHLYRGCPIYRLHVRHTRLTAVYSQSVSSRSMSGVQNLRIDL